MKVIINNIVYKYKSYRDSNDLGDMWCVTIYSIDGVNVDYTEGYSFSEDKQECKNNCPEIVWENTKQKLSNLMCALYSENKLHVVKYPD